jgi:hypothetical protein
MRCLTCGQPSHDARDAVAICVLCGAGVCLDHVRSYDVTTYSLQPGGMVPMRRPDPQPLRVYLCPRCADLMHDVDSDRPAAHGHYAEVLDGLADRARVLQQLRGSARPIPAPVV